MNYDKDYLLLLQGLDQKILENLSRQKREEHHPMPDSDQSGDIIQICKDNVQRLREISCELQCIAAQPI